MALRESGLVAGILFMLVVAIMAASSLNMIIWCGDQLRVSTFQDVMGKCFGTKGFVLMVLIQVAASFWGRSGQQVNLATNHLIS